MVLRTHGHRHQRRCLCTSAYRLTPRNASVDKTTQLSAVRKGCKIDRDKLYRPGGRKLVSEVRGELCDSTARVTDQNDELRLACDWRCGHRGKVEGGDALRVRGAVHTPGA